MAREKYPIELTREEALMMVLLARSSESSTSRVYRAVEGIARALESGDPALVPEQCEIWAHSGRNTFDLSDGPQVPTEEL